MRALRNRFLADLSRLELPFSRLHDFVPPMLRLVAFFNARPPGSLAPHHLERYLDHLGLIHACDPSLEAFDHEVATIRLFYTLTCPHPELVALLTSHRWEDRLADDLRLRHASPCTVDGYVRAIHAFLASVPHLSPTSLSQEDIRLYLVSRISAGPGALKRDIAALKYFFSHTVHRPELVSHLHYPHIPRRLPTLLSGSQVDSLLNRIQQPTPRLVLTLCYAAGLRISESPGRNGPVQNVLSGQG